jgi:membrane fusion protein, copper/silver efflux system
VKKTIRTVGRVLYDERRISAVSLRVGGWVEELRLKAVGDPIKKGQPILSIYSPDLLEAQKNYLLALAVQPAAGHPEHGTGESPLAQSLRSARDRLLLWGLTEGQLKEIEAAKEPRTRVEILSQVEGVVIEKSIVQGAYVETGKDLFRIADLSSVWIEIDLHQPDLPLVKVGDKVKVTLPSSPGETFDETVAYISPWLERESRTARARIEAPNPEGKLKPGMYATASIECDLGEALAVDEDAILDTGARQIAFVEKGDGVLEPREVKIGARADGLVVVLEGLEEGEKVVTSANFLIDSESKIKAALSQAGGRMGGVHQHGAGGSPEAPAARKAEGGPEASGGHQGH